MEKCKMLAWGLFDHSNEVATSSSSTVECIIKGVLNMNEISYKQMIEEAKFGFANHKLIVNEFGEPEDFIFLQVNRMFEIFTGLTAEKIVNKKVSEVIPNIKSKSVNWISRYGEVAISGGRKEFTHFDEQCGRWFKIQVFSSQKNYFTTVFFDITKEKKYSEDLEEFLSVNSDLFFIINSEGVLLNVNKEWISILGYSKEELYDRNFLDFVHPEDLELTMDFLSDLKLGARVLNFRNRYRCKDGSYLVFEWRSQSKSREVIYLAARDVTERIAIENKLKTSSERLRFLFSDIPNIAVQGFDMTGKTLYWNKASEKMYGYTAEEAVGENLLNLIIPDELKKKVKKDIATMAKMKKSVPSSELLLKRKDGSPVHVYSSHAYVDIPGSEPELYCMDVDLTDRVVAEESLKENEEILRQITDNMGEVFWLRSAETQEIIYISPAYEKIWGRSRKSLYQNEKLFIKSIHPDDRDRVIQEHENYEKKWKFKTEYRILRPDGDIRWVQVRLFPVRNANGDVIRHTGIAIDITENKKAEVKLKNAKAEADKANKAKSQFLSNLSHEIRTPLNGVLGFAELLEKTEIDSLQKQYIDNIITSSNSLLNIIGDLLTYSSINSGNVDVVSNRTDIWELVASTVGLVEEQARDKGLELLVNIENNVPQIVMIDPVKVRKIIIHLLTNAIKFTHQGEVELKLCFTPTDKSSGRLHLSVRDTGVGINNKEKENIFKAFSQVDNSNTRKYGGAGLGLMICNLLAKSIGCNIQFKSEKGVGSTFHFSVDTNFEGKIQLSKFSTIKKVMVIDDNDSNRGIIENIFTESEISCDTFSDSKSAIRHLEHFGPYDVVLVDYSMPVVNGIEVIKKIRMVEHKLKNLPAIILMHDEDDSNIHQNCEFLDVDGFLRKPLMHKKLNKMLQSIDSVLPKGATAKKLLKNGSQDQFNRKNLMVLIAEDNKMNMMLNKILVSKILPDCIILEAESGRKAVQLMEENDVNIILMDIQMPEMDGIEATKMIRMKEKRTGKHTPIIAVTAGAMDQEKDRCLSSGMDEFMTKPVDSGELHKLLLNHLPIVSVAG